MGSFTGARVIAIPTDAVTGEPIEASNLSGSGGLLELASGWADGRLFLGDDIAGLIVWIAPVAP